MGVSPRGNIGRGDRGTPVEDDKNCVERTGAKPLEE